MKRALAFSAVMLAIWIVLTMLVGCAAPEIEYQPIPAMLIPPKPVLPKIPAVELECLSSPTYFDLATRDRLLRQDNEVLRALLGATP